MTKKEKLFISGFTLTCFLTGFTLGEITTDRFPKAPKEPTAYELLERAYEIIDSNE